MDKQYSLLILSYIIIASSAVIELFSSVGDGHDANNPYTSNIESIVGEVDTSRCQDIEIEFMYKMGSFHPSWQVPLWIGNGNKIYAQFGVYYLGLPIDNDYVTLLFAYSDQDGNYINDIATQSHNVLGSNWRAGWVKIQLQMRSNGEFRMFENGHLPVALNMKPLIYLPKSGELQQIIVGKSGILTGNSKLYNIKIKCLSCKLPLPPPKCVIPEICTTEGALDIGFLIDESHSIGTDSYNTMKEFIQRLIKYDINEHSFVSLFRYSSDFNQLIDFTENNVNGQQQLINLLDGRISTGGGTNTGAAIKDTLNIFDMNNARKDLLFVLTDGDSNDDVCNIVSNTDIGNTEIVLIGVGEGLDINTLRSNEYSCLYDNVDNDVYYVPDFNSESFESIENDLREKTCIDDDVCASDISGMSAHTPFEYILSKEPMNDNNIYNNINTLMFILIMSGILNILLILLVIYSYQTLKRYKGNHIYQKVNKLPQKQENQNYDV